MAEQHKAKVYVTPGHATEHDAAGHHAPEYVRGQMDITQQKRTFEGFIRFWVYVFGGTAAILIFLALFSA